MLLPRYVDEHAEAVLDRFIKQPIGRRKIEADARCTELVYMCEIAIDVFCFWQELSEMVRSKRAVAEAPCIPLLLGRAKKLSANPNPFVG